MSTSVDISFDEANEDADVTSIIAEFPPDDVDDSTVSSVPIKKLENAFENIAKCESTGNSTVSQLRVFLRVRPISAKLENTIVVDSETSIISTAPMISNRAKYTKTEERSYTFNRVFGPSSGQDEVFEHSVEPLMDRFLNGENCVFIAYGMTNAGKTHTIQGDTANPGSLPRLVEEIFQREEILHEECELSLSILEIYQEDIFDLLRPDNKKKEKLKIRDGGEGRMEVSKLSAHSINSSAEAFKLMDQAAFNRSKSRTLLNSGSSRSHAVYSLVLKKESGMSVFQIVDLAGAER